MEDEKNRFAQFIADLALDPGTLAGYKKDAEAAMQAAGLSDEEKGMLRKGDFRIICEFLGPTVPRPIDIEPPLQSGGPGQ